VKTPSLPKKEKKKLGFSSNCFLSMYLRSLLTKLFILVYIPAPVVSEEEDL